MSEFLGLISRSADTERPPIAKFIDRADRIMRERLNCADTKISRTSRVVLICGGDAGIRSGNDDSFVVDNGGHPTIDIESLLNDPPSAIARVQPPFAVAAGRNDGTEVDLFTDWMAMQPLYYCDTGNGQFLFATDMRLLMRHPDVDYTPSRQSLFDFVHFHVIPGPQTVFDRIRKVPPASRLRYRNGSIAVAHYWPAESQASSGSIDQLQIDTLLTLQDSVRRNVDPRGPTACFLSGGLDSSTIAGLASRVTETHAFSIGFDEPGYDEMAYAQIAAAHFGLSHHTYYVSRQDVHDTLPLVAAGFGEPFGNLSSIPVFHCARLAREAGFDTMLAGDGGDELFAGNERYIRQKLFGHYQRLPGALRHALEPQCRRLLGSRVRLLRKIGRYVDIAKKDLPARLLYDFEHFQGYLPQAIFDARFMQHVDTDNPLHVIAAIVERSPDSDLIEQLLWTDWHLTLADNDLRKVHYMCKAAAIQPRYPMLDMQVIELSRQIPGRQKLTSTRLRHFYKHAVADLLPQEIIDKRKHGFGLPFGEWLRDDPQLAGLVDESLARIRQRGIFNDSFIDDCRHNQQTVHAAYFGSVIGALLLLDLWLEEFQGWL